MVRCNSHAVDRVRVELSRRIREGVYTPNTYLPSERDLAKELCISRVTLSAALAELQEAGLVERQHGRGTRVLSPLDALSTPLIGVIHGDYSKVPMSASQGSMATLHGVQQGLTRVHYRYEMVGFPRPHGVHADAFKRFGAMLFVEHLADDNVILRELKERSIPTVIAKLESEGEVTCTYVDHFQPTLDAVRMFVNLGHRRIAFLGRDPSFGAHGRKREGYLAGLREAGLPVEEALIAVCQSTEPLSAYVAAKTLLALPHPPTAVVAARDSIAAGVCHAIEERDLVIGHDISVIGFDDLTWSTPEPILSTFREPCFDMGVAAADMLVARIADRSLPIEKRRFDTPFILRRSVGPPMPARGSLRTRTKATPDSATAR